MSGYSEYYVCIYIFGEPQEREAGKQALVSSTSLPANSAEDERCIDVHVFSLLLRANSTEDEKYVYVYMYVIHLYIYFLDVTSCQ